MNNPPDGGGDPSAEAAGHTIQTTDHHEDQQGQYKDARTNIARHPLKSHVWRYADPWQAVFRRGWRCALTSAAREIDDIDALAVLAGLADRYHGDQRCE